VGKQSEQFRTSDAFLESSFWYPGGGLYTRRLARKGTKIALVIKRCASMGAIKKYFMSDSCYKFQ
jgi:hypothetical protein